MGKFSAQTEGVRKPSKYAEKVAARKSGKREEFQFQERSTPEPEPATPKTISAIVTQFIPSKGAVFLEAEGRYSLFLSFSVLKRDCRDQGIKKGFILECEIVDQPNGKGPRVTRILSVNPPIHERPSNSV